MPSEELADDVKANQDRIRRIEESVIKLNHFTELFPKVVAAQFDTVKEMTRTNRALLWLILVAVVGAGVAVLFVR